MDIKLISGTEIDQALELILRVFMEFEAPVYSREGVDSFVKDVIRNENFRNDCITGKFKMYGAFDGEKIVAVMTMRKVSHIMLAFVDRDYQRQGIGKMLFEHIRNDLRSCSDSISDITVNASPYLPTSTSYGKTILADGKYVGDIWCYCIDKADTPNAMLSYCVFDESSWNKGIATDAILLFLEEIKNKFNLESIGAFTYSDNLASIRVLEKSGFELIEAFEEEGRESKYFQRNF